MFNNKTTQVLFMISTFFSLLIVVAFYCDMFFSFSHQGWMVVTLLAMLFCSLGTGVRLVLLRCMVMLAALFVSAVCREITFLPVGLALFCVSLFAVSPILFGQEKEQASSYLLFSSVLLLSNFMSADASFYAQAIDILIVSGVMVCFETILTVFLIKPVFIQLLEQSFVYLQDMIVHITRFERAAKTSHFPLYLLQQRVADWVFARGFSPGLRGGYRHYMLQIERAIELFELIQYKAPLLVEYPEVRSSFLSVMSNQQLLLASLSDFFSKRGSLFDAADWMHDINELECVIESRLPSHLSLLHLDSQPLILIELLRACKDSREVLLQLVMMLPSQER